MDRIIDDILRKLNIIKNSPPRNMASWSPRDAWLTAVNACINEVEIAKNKDLEKL